MSLEWDDFANQVTSHEAWKIFGCYDGLHVEG